MTSLSVLLLLFVSLTVATIAGRLRRLLSQKRPTSLRAGSRDVVEAVTSGSAKDKAGREQKSKTPVCWEPRIEPLNGFVWDATSPLKLRPIKPTYNITMAIQNSTPSDLIVMDNNYRDRVLSRRKLIEEHPSVVMGAIASGHKAVLELYSYLLGTYLPRRYPTMFSLDRPSSGPSEIVFRNKVTGRSLPLVPPPSEASEMLRALGETVEDDMFLVLRDPDGGEHRAVAYVCCHPSGFDPSEKLGKRLAEIHSPVPAYSKIGASMERYFSRLEVGKSVKRVNWAIQTHPNLYAPSGNHVHPGEDVEEDEDVDVRKARFRVELQTLTRLPKTQAILFSFKTYLYTLDEIKAEGLGPQLAEAIEGLKTGNAPGMWVYKGGVRWGKAVCAYLRT